MKKLFIIIVVLAIVYTVLPEDIKHQVRWYVDEAYDYISDYASWYAYK